MAWRLAPLTSIWPCFFAAWIAGSCTEPSRDSPDAGGALTVVDATGRELAFTHTARRIVSLVPSAASTLHAMHADHLLVGRTDFDTESWAERLPSVGGGIEPNLEAIVALRPDVVIRFAGEQDARTATRLDQLGIPHVAVRPDRIEDIYRTARILGRLTGLDLTADSLIERIRRDLDQTAESVAGLPRKRVAYVLGGTPPWVAGPGTYIDEVVSMVGGDNAFADLGALYSAVSPEELLSRDIEVVLVSGPEAYDFDWTPGARIEVVGEALEIPGPSVVEAARLVARLIHGNGPR